MKKHFVLFGLLSLLTSGCLVKIKNGIIPEKYIQYSKTYQGIYSGTFEGQRRSMKISVNEAGYAKVEFDLINNSSSILTYCDSTVGNLKYVDVNRNEKKINKAVFQFNSSGCNIDGKELILDTSKSSEVILKIAKSIQTIPDSSCGGGVNNVGCDNGSNTVIVDTWLLGEFKKVSN